MAAELIHHTQISHLYVTVLGRVPDSAGLAFWAEALADGMPLADITRDFLQTAEAQAGYPVGVSADEFVANFYQAVFNRAPDAAGLQFWTDAMWQLGGPQSAEARAFIVQALVEAVSTPLATRPEGMSEDTYAQTVLDRTIFANKVEVSLFFGLARETSFEQTRGVLALVDATPGSVDAAKDFDPTQPTPNPEPNPEPNPNPNPDPGPGPIDQTYTKTLAQIHPAATPFSGTTGENDTLILRGIDKNLVEGITVTRGIETVNLDQVAMVVDGVTIDASVFEGATQIGVGDESPGRLNLTGMADKTLRLYSEEIDWSGGGDKDRNGEGDKEFELPAPMGFTTVDHGDATSVTVVLDSPRTHNVAFVSESLQTVSLSGSGWLSMRAPSITTLNIAAVGEGISMSANGDAFAKLITVDASASTADLSLNGVLPDSYKGGSGQDWLYIVADYLGDRSLDSLELDGGEGDDDRLTFDLAGVDVGQLNHRNIEQLYLYNANLPSYDISGFALTYLFASLKNPLNLTQAEAGSTLMLGGEYGNSGANNSHEITYSLANDTDADLLNIAFEWMVRDAVVNAEKIETVRIDAGTEMTESSITIRGDSLARIDLQGIGKVVLDLDQATLSPALTIDASALQGGLDLTVVNPGNATALTITGSASAENTLRGGAGNDIIKGGSMMDVIHGGEGNDTLYGGAGDTLFGEAGDDLFVPGLTADMASRVKIADFSGGDRISLEEVVTGGIVVDDATFVPVDDALSLEQKVAAVLGASSEEATQPVLHYFQHQDNTFILIDNSPLEPGFISGADQLIELTGQVFLAVDSGFLVQVQ